jgi:D-glycero-alpha-D-manno-heptose-7-phosphate kinase
MDDGIAVKSRAPSRIGIAGGGSDLPSFFENNGGAVLNVGINLYSYATLEKIDQKFTRIVSHDWDIERDIDELGLEFEKNRKDNVDLVKATMEYAGLNPKSGYRLIVHSAAPRNSGLAGSSALVVSIMAAIFNAAGKPMMNREKLANTAYHIERVILKRAGGYQDEYAAVFGGFNFIELEKGKINVFPLRLESDLVSELHSSMLLFEIPELRKEAASNVEVLKDKEIRKGGESIEYLKKIRDYAYEMKDSLIRGNVRNMGELLDQSWKEKRKLPGVTSPGIEKLYKIGIDAGAYGGKLCGAGGGGFMFFMSDLDERKKIINSMAKAGARMVNFDFDFNGMVTWRTELR